MQRKLNVRHASLLVCLAIVQNCVLPALLSADDFVDIAHNSSVFGEERNYRVILPASYNANEATSYPVVYYLHGWSERYNVPTHGELPLESMEQIVAEKDSFILVIPDGSMNPNDERPNVRPYNIGENHTGDRGTPFDVHFSDYFLELVGHVDQNFRTISNREGRALFGYSMGGFMSFDLAGNYPHMISAVVDHLGSPEFYIGDTQRRVLNKKRDLTSNLHGVRYRLQAGTRDFLRFLGDEVNQTFQRDPTLSYEFELNESNHALAARDSKIENFAEGINFLVDVFQNPLPRPTRWHHTDMDAEFDKWGYQVTSNLLEPGFISLRGVTHGGFEVSTKKWTAEGPYVPGVEINIQTDSLYQPNTDYQLLSYNLARDSASTSTVTSDAQGRITVSANHEDNQFGIYNQGDPAELVTVGHLVDGSRQFLSQGQTGDLRLRFLNRGGSATSGMTATISTLEPNVTIENPTVVLDDIDLGATVWSPAIKINAAKPAPDNR
ncbi:MAG: hypothetical protein KDB27_31695, partial [Planctomycetales bacterium]|nr:hypothetical protein [Planctomycetales bacterium]